MKRRITCPEIVIELQEGPLPKIERPRQTVVHVAIEARARELHAQGLSIYRASQEAVYEARGNSVSTARKYGPRDKPRASGSGIDQEQLVKTIAQRLRRNTERRTT